MKTNYNVFGPTVIDTTEGLEKLIDEHDCHLSKDDGCVCSKFRNELVQLKEAQ